MKYLDIEMYGYERFSLNGFRDFRATFNAPLQLILGTNGSGKSSLLERLSPLPADASDFSKDGREIKTISHNGKTYILAVDFSSDKKYSFVVDGQELNTTHSVTVQKELVRKHFNITQEVHDLIRGVEPFTEMSPNRRKEWFLKLCTENYDYALTAFNRIKEALRDTQGALKIARNTLVSETNKMVSEDTIEHEKRVVEALHRCVSVLLDHRKPSERDLDQLFYNARTQLGQLTQLAIKLDRVKQASASLTHTKTQYQQMLQDNVEAYQRLMGKMQVTLKRHTSLSEIRDALAKADIGSLDELKQKLTTLDSRISALQTSRQFTSEKHYWAEDSLDRFDRLREQMSEIVSQMPSNKDRRYTQQAMERAKHDLEILSQKKVGLQRDVDTAKHELSHIDIQLKNPDQSCPKCQHKFSAGVDASVKAVWSKALESASQQLHEVSTKFAEVQDFASKCNEFAMSWRAFHSTKSVMPELSEHWSWLVDSGYLHEQVDGFALALDKIRNDLLTQLELHKTQTEFELAKQTFEVLTANGSQDLSRVSNELAQLDTQMSEDSSYGSSLIAEKKSITESISILDSLESLKQKILEQMDEIKTNAKIAQEEVRREQYNSCVRYVQTQLSHMEAQISRHLAQKSIVDRISNDVAHLQQREKSLQALLRALSPTEGLIAEGMLGFIRHFIEQMNEFVSKIWSYEFEIMSCEVSSSESVDLNYRFPIKVPGRIKPRKDVKEGSSGMTEITDLAFRYVAMQYLGLGGHPIYLDEFGRTFDQAHKAASVNVIKAMADQNIFPQVFLISHDHGQYGALANCEVMVLNPLNVSTPMGTKFNLHVEMV